MQFTIRARDGPEWITWEDGKLETHPPSLAEILTIEAEIRRSGGIEYPVGHYVSGDILAQPLGALAIILNYLKGRGYDYSGDEIPPPDGGNNPNTVY